MKLVLRHQAGEVEIVSGDAGRVVSRAGTVHKAAPRSVKTLCGMQFITYHLNWDSNEVEPNDDLTWPTSHAPVTCGRCLRIGYPGLTQPEGAHKDQVLENLARMDVDEDRKAAERRHRHSMLAARQVEPTAADLLWANLGEDTNGS